VVSIRTVASGANLDSSVEKHTALEFHLKAEYEAKQHYERRRLDLSDFVKARVKTSVEKKVSHKRRTKKS
jgi:hypothetical protein